MKIFVFEHLCSGAEADHDLPQEMAASGGAMLRAVAEDLARLGVSVTTCLDARLSLPLHGVAVTHVDSQPAAMAAFDRLSADADRTLVIAPENQDLLPRWLRRLDEAARPTLNCHWRTAELCGDKLSLAEHLTRHHIPTPSTKLFKSGDAIRLPAVIKPRRSANCERTCFISTMKHAEETASLDSPDDLIIQDYASGLPASCAVIAGPAQARSLLPGEQLVCIHFGQPRGAFSFGRFSYEGGRIPLPDRDPSLAPRAASLARRAVETLPSTHGYLGVDLSLGKSADDDHVIEINPRLSMSYVGLRALCRTNLAAALLDPAAPLEWSHSWLRFDTAGRITWEPEA